MKISLIDRQKNCTTSNFLLVKFYLELNGHKVTVSDHTDDDSDIVFYCGCALTDKIIEVNTDEIVNIKDKPVFTFGCISHFLKSDTSIDEIFYTCVTWKLAKEMFVDTSGNNTGMILVSEGCKNNCSYCNVKLAKKELKSTSLESIFKQLDYYVSRNKYRVILASDDLSFYGQDIGTNLEELLTLISTNYPNVKLILRAINPKGIIDYFPLLEKMIRTNQIVKVTVDIQSGSNRILSLMNRNYDIDLFIQYWSKISPFVESITNIIYGFPTETESDFESSLLIAKYFTHINFVEFVPNKNTSSYNLSKLPLETVEQYRNILERNKLKNWNLCSSEVLTNSCTKSIYN